MSGFTDSGQMSRDIWTLLALEVFEPPTFGFRSPPMELDRVKTELSVQYVDHNLLEADERNADDHLFLYSACRRGAPGGAGHALPRREPRYHLVVNGGSAVTPGRNVTGTFRGARRAGCLRVAAQRGPR